MKAHSGDESNKCNHCDYASSQAGHLRRHLKTHGEKSNKCNQCDCATSQVNPLMMYLQTHSEKRQIITTNVTFSQAGSLKAHLKIHSGVKVKTMQPV